MDCMGFPNLSKKRNLCRVAFRSVGEAPKLEKDSTTRWASIWSDDLSWGILVGPSRKNGLVRSRSELKKWPKLELELGEFEWLQILKSVAKWWFQSLFSCTLCLRMIQFDDNLMKTVQLCTSSVTLGIFQIIASSHRFYLQHEIYFFIICFQIERKKNLESRLWISPCTSRGRGLEKRLRKTKKTANRSGGTPKICKR